ncbi:MAG TPA: UrcA family protein [Sphingomicrobium sp.]|nr:UrcA family protein [Sphingomicrobium sp.]
MLKTIPAIGALAFAAALVVPTVSQAADRESARVSYADLDLSSLEGRDSLERRVTSAADQLCGVGKWSGFALENAALACSARAAAGAQPADAEAIAASRTGSVTVLDAAALIVTAQ